MVGCIVCRFVNWLFGWPVGLLFVYFVAPDEWYIDCLFDWLAVWFIDRIVDLVFWFIRCLVCGFVVLLLLRRLVCWLIDSLIGCLLVWLLY